MVTKYTTLQAGSEQQTCSLPNVREARLILSRSSVLT